MQLSIAGTLPAEQTEPPATPAQALSARDVYSALGTSARGLTVAEVAERRRRFGANELPTPPKPKILRRLLVQFTDLFALSSYLIPARALPALPDSVSTAMGYRYASGE